MSGDSMSPKAHKFLVALRRLCRSHDVQLSTSGYDGIEIWDLRPGEEPIHSNGLEDKTKGSKQPQHAAGRDYRHTTNQR